MNHETLYRTHSWASQSSHRQCPRHWVSLGCPEKAPKFPTPSPRGHSSPNLGCALRPPPAQAWAEHFRREWASPCWAQDYLPRTPTPAGQPLPLLTQLSAHQAAPVLWPPEPPARSLCGQGLLPQQRGNNKKKRKNKKGSPGQPPTLTPPQPLHRRRSPGLWRENRCLPA